MSDACLNGYFCDKGIKKTLFSIQLGCANKWLHLCTVASYSWFIAGVSGASAAGIRGATWSAADTGHRPRGQLPSAVHPHWLQLTKPNLIDHKVKEDPTWLNLNPNTFGRIHCVITINRFTIVRSLSNFSIMDHCGTISSCVIYSTFRKLLSFLLPFLYT